MWKGVWLMMERNMLPIPNTFVSTKTATITAWLATIDAALQRCQHSHVHEEGNQALGNPSIATAVLFGDGLHGKNEGRQFKIFI